MSDENQQEDLIGLSSVIGALHKVASDQSSYQKTLEHAGADYEQVLQRQLIKDLTEHPRTIADKTAALHTLQPYKENSAVLERIKMVSGLTDRQLGLVTKSGILKIDQYGSPTLDGVQAKLLSKNKGITYLFVLGVLTGVVACQIIYQPMANAATVFGGLGIGMAIGSVAGPVLDRSFRAYPVVEELKKLTPWMAISGA